ncbi:hypothetical protein L3055_04705 [Corynebacterium sp. MC-02]|nr:hypothetical protein [Corynebacterium pseudokroppenstedtii]MCF8702854.1 hypothetical protein [Corynebacterium pseudokroppenstedtii]
MTLAGVVSVMSLGVVVAVVVSLVVFMADREGVADVAAIDSPSFESL